MPPADPAADAFMYAYRRIMEATQLSDLVSEGREVGQYRSLAKTVHPDTVIPRGYTSQKTEAFAKLSKLWDEYNGKVDPITIKTKRGEHPLGDLVATGHIANVYSSGPNVVKMPRSHTDNDLMEREVKALKKLDAEADPQYRIYAPKLVETFRHRDAARVERRCSVFERLDGFFTLAQVKEAYPNGLDPRDLAWIWRRLFVAIGLAADNGLVHGSVNPGNVMVHPVDHGVVLVGWALACDTSTDQKVPAVDPAWPHFVSAAIGHKEVPTSRIDTFAMAQTMTWMLDNNYEHASKFRAFARGCAVQSPPPASQLLAEFDELLADTYGKRKYRKLEMPA